MITAIALATFMVGSSVRVKVQGQEEQQSEDLSCFARFAQRCLGKNSLKDAGGKLGLMGWVSESDFREVLESLQTKVETKHIDSCVPFGSTLRAECFPQIQKDADFGLLGYADMSAALFHKVRANEKGCIDLPQVFGMAKIDPAGACAVDGSAKFFEGCADLQRSLPGDIEERERGEAYLTSTASDKDWKADVAALNRVRAAACNAVISDTSKAQFQDVLEAMEKRAASRRPALAKTTLKAFVNLAESEDGVSWDLKFGPAVQGCLQAARGTKASARLAPPALEAVLRRAARDASPLKAVQVLEQAIQHEKEAQRPSAAALLLGIQVLKAIVPLLAHDPAALQSGKRACEKVLAKGPDGKFKFAKLNGDVAAVQCCLDAAGPDVAEGAQHHADSMARLQHAQQAPCSTHCAAA